MNTTNMSLIVKSMKDYLFKDDNIDDIKIPITIYSSSGKIISVHINKMGIGIDVGDKFIKIRNLTISDIRKNNGFTTYEALINKEEYTSSLRILTNINNQLLDEY